LAELGISVEMIDARTLLPFDREHRIVESLKKTSRLLVVDEDVPGGASAYILQQSCKCKGGYRWLDSAPSTLTAKAHRPAYGTDGDYFSKPSVEDVVEKVMVPSRLAATVPLQRHPLAGSCHAERSIGHGHPVPIA
jgi:pyruvate/2-oxoglutarate/acetoin dehydrogenase E1 component